jgi:hypothetical protein
MRNACRFCRRLAGIPYLARTARYSAVDHDDDSKVTSSLEVRDERTTRSSNLLDLQLGIHRIFT